MDLAIEILKGIGLSVVIGIAFLIVPFGMLVLVNMLPWLICQLPLVRNLFIKESKENLDNFSQYKQVYIDYCHPSQVIKRLKSYGLQSLFRNNRFPQTPINKPNTFSDENTPEKFLESTNPKPVDNKLDNFH